MVDAILNRYTDWRFTNVKAGDKVPFPNGWQNTPLTLQQVTSSNIGLLLGEKSGGVMAIDFDGTTAWSWFEENIGCRLPPTTMWSSGKPDRCQMAFQVPPEAWKFIRTRKVVTKPASAPGAGDGEGIEFRWNGCQSVLPPSSLNDGRKYVWYSTEAVSEIPVEVLERWIQECEPKKPIVDDRPLITIDDLTDNDVEETTKILKRLKSRRPVLSYDEWLTVSFGIASHVGTQVAEVMLQEYYPEQSRGEYRRLFKAYNASRSPTIGSVVFLAGPEPKVEHKYKKPLAELKKILEKI